MHTACRTLLESHCLHRVLDQTTRAHVVRTWRKIRHAEIAEIVSDGLSGSGNLFSSTWLKVDAESEGLKALHCFPVFVRDLPCDDSCRRKLYRGKPAPHVTIGVYIPIGRPPP